MCRVDFIVAGLEDIRFLCRIWEELLWVEGQRYSESSLVTVAVDRLFTDEGVTINFTGEPALVDKFLAQLEQAGLKFTKEDFIPGLIAVCKMDRDRGGHGVSCDKPETW